MADYNAALAVSRALHGVLASDINIQDQLGVPPRLYDDAPEDPIFPYLTYGPMRSEDISAQGAIITSHVLSLHIWSRYSGRAELLTLLGLISGSVSHNAMPLDGANLVTRRVTFTDIFRAADGLTQHGVVRLRLITERALESL